MVNSREISDMEPGNKIPKFLDFILTFLVVVLYLLSKIGDGIIWFFKQPVEITIKVINFLTKKRTIKKIVPAKPGKSIFSHLWSIFNQLRLTAFTIILFPFRILLAFINLGISLTTRIGKKTLNLLKRPLFVKPTIDKKPGVSKFKIKKIFKFRKPRFSFYSFILGVSLTILFIFIPYNFYLFLKSLPNPTLLTQNHFPVTTKIYDRNGNQLYEIFGPQNRTPIKLEEVPKQLIDATIAIEDKEFYYHPGVSTRGITRALKSLIIDKELQGGSTITQQLIKSALLSPERTVQRKIREILLAFWAERLYTKDQILEMYLNQVPYGGTAWGIQAAAENYFGKNVQDLTLSESTLLAGLPAAPTYYSPFGAHPERAEIRKNQVIDEMIKTGAISKEEGESAKQEKITYAPQITNIKAPHFVMYVKELLEQKYGIRRVEQGGLRVITSLDLSLQEKAQEIVSREIQDLKPLSVGNGASLVTNPKTGEILAMVGSKDYFNQPDQGNVNITTSLQQPGSSIKVVTYATALENGFTSASVLDDSPVAYPVFNQSTYAPVNYDGKFHGKITLRKALGNSYNIPAVKTLAQVGLEKMIIYGRNMGINSWPDSSRFGLSLTLGGGEVTMLDMARAYGTLANSGIERDLTPILKITTYEGETLEEINKEPAKQAIKPETAFILTSILSDNDARADAFGTNSKLVIPGKTVAVKTGTSNDKRDNWTIGYTPSFVVTVWVGNNDNSPMNPILTSGITGATPIWNEIMNFLLKDKNDESFPQPPGIISMPCYGKVEYFVSGTQPLDGCPVIVQNTPTPSPTP